jgi:hypothetical protein
VVADGVVGEGDTSEPVGNLTDASFEAGLSPAELTATTVK